MKVFYQPQVSTLRLEYSVEGERLTATLGHASDTFDFTGLPEGQAEGIETSLEINPILSARRDAEGVLWVELLNFIGEDASEAEKWPEWERV